jgi:hypothetical protein
VEKGEELAEKPGVVDSFEPNHKTAGSVADAKSTLHAQVQHLKLPAWAQAYLGGCISCH